MINKEYIFGSSDACDISIAGASIGEQHFKINQLGDDEFELADLGSKAGTFLNGRKIESTEKLTSKDQITIDGNIVEWYSRINPNPVRKQVVEQDDNAENPLIQNKYVAATVRYGILLGIFLLIMLVIPGLFDRLVKLGPVLLTEVLQGFFYASILIVLFYYFVAINNILKASGKKNLGKVSKSLGSTFVLLLIIKENFFSIVVIKLLKFGGKGMKLDSTFVGDIEEYFYLAAALLLLLSIVILAARLIKLMTGNQLLQERKN